MTDREKAIVTAYTGVTMLMGEKFSIFHKYIQDLLGRPIWTHELASEAVWNEIKEKSKPDFLKLCVDELDWVPIKYRPLTEEERIKFSEYFGVEYCDTLSEQAFDCPMPTHDQEILITTNWGVQEDVCLYDPDEGYSLEERGDWDGVIAWMKKPEPYKEDTEAEDI